MTRFGNRRSKNMSERNVQGTLLLHLAGHWVFFLVATRSAAVASDDARSQAEQLASR